MNPVVGKITYEQRQIVDGDHHIITAGKLKSANGTLEAGLVLCKNADGVLVGVDPQSVDMAGTRDGTNKAFTLASASRPILPGSLVVTHGTQEILDDGHGVLYGDGSGTVNYRTGAVAATFTAAPANGSSAPVAAFEDVPDSVLLEQVDTTAEDAAPVLVHGAARKSKLVDADGNAVSDGIIEALRARGIFA